MALSGTCSWRIIYIRELENTFQELTKDKLQGTLGIRMNVLLYCVGDLIKAVSYALYYTGSIHSKGYAAEIKIALSDVYTQVHIVMKWLGMDIKNIWSTAVKFTSIINEERGIRDLLNIFSLKICKLVGLIYKLKSIKYEERQPRLSSRFADIYAYLQFLIRELGFDEKEIAMLGIQRHNEILKTRLLGGKA
jgi:hypothetical protein